jgi:succinate dehydrogenase/fumarate reductase flavoprotein subunit
MEIDVLVVGSEGGGAVAAVAAAEAGASVVVVSKGKAGRSGATQTAGADFMADARSVIEVLGYSEGDNRDSPDEFMIDVVQEGKYLSNQKLVEVYVRDAPYRIRELIGWGMRVTSIEKAHGSRFPRGVMTTGPDIARALRNGIRMHNVPLIEDVFVTDILTRDGRAVGAVGLEQRTGAVIILKAGAVVLATGGWQMAYPWTTATNDLSGDGQAMAYRAGAELVDMEMVQFLPGIIINPPAWRRTIFLYAFPAGVLLNRYGEAFLRHWDPLHEDRPIAQWPKEIVSIAIKVEVLEGRGSPAGGVYLSLKHLPNNLIGDVMKHQRIGEWESDRLDTDAMVQYLKEGNAIEVTGDAVHYTTGGIRVDENLATLLPGLFAAGECTGGTFGAERVCSACTEMIVGGHIAGNSAARFAVSAGKAEPHPAQVDQLVDAIYRPLERSHGPRPIPVRQNLQRIAGDKVGVVRTGSALTEAVDELVALRQQVEGLATTTKTLRFNREWIEALQMRNLLPVVEASARSALLRTESRGGHYRRDFPMTDNDNWLVNIVARRKETEPDLHKAPVVVTKVPLVGGVVSYEESSRR